VKSFREIYSSCEKRLKDEVLLKGKNLGNGILKVDFFINHQIYPEIMEMVGESIASFFEDKEVTKVITVESSGIVPAYVAAKYLGVPMVFARKSKPITMEESICDSAPSHTKGGIVHLHISKEFLNKEDSVLIVDDFLASGKTIEALCKMLKSEEIDIAGVAAVIEKTFELGRDLLKTSFDFPVLSMLRIASLENGKIILE